MKPNNTIYRSPVTLEPENDPFMVTQKECEEAKKSLSFLDHPLLTATTVTIITAVVATENHLWIAAVTAWFFSACFLIRIRKHLKTIDRWHDQERKKASQIN